MDKVQEKTLPRGIGPGVHCTVTLITKMQSPNIIKRSITGIKHCQKSFKLQVHAMSSRGLKRINYARHT
jgi:hypothetical protein